MSVLASASDYLRNWLNPLNPALYGSSGRGILVRTRSGEVVSEDRALNLATYFACVRNIAEDVAKLPFPTFERMIPRGKQKVPAHPVGVLLNRNTNVDVDAFYFRAMMTHFAESWGNAYAEISRGSDNRPVALFPIHPGFVDNKRDSEGNHFYRVWSRMDDASPRNVAVDIDPQNMLHIRGLGGDGTTGYSVARLAAESIGHAMAAETYGAAYFGNGATGGIVLKHAGEMKDDAYNRLKQSWMETHAGAANAYNPIILEDGVTIDRMGIPPEEAQFIETRQHGVEEICRWFRMPPHKVQHLLRSTFSNIEQQSIEYVTDTLLPWARRWEVEVNRKLYRPDELDELFSEHVFEGALRGDQAARGEFYTKMFQMGSMSPNDIRERENLNPIDGGDEYFVQVNLAPLSGVEDEDMPLIENEDDDDNDEQRDARIASHKRAHCELLTMTIHRSLVKESKAARRASNKHKGDDEGFAEWADKFYHDHEAAIRSDIESHYRAMALSVCAEMGCDVEASRKCAGRMAGAYLSSHVDRSVNELMTIGASVCDDWLTSRAATVASDEIDTLTAAIAAIGASDEPSLENAGDARTGD